ncbi:MAG: hypothetical protein AAGF67_15255 [Verrucomicrobiota bacterium]
MSIRVANTPPDANNDIVSMRIEELSIDIDVLANDDDNEADTLTLERPSSTTSLSEASP